MVKPARVNLRTQSAGKKARNKRKVAMNSTEISSRIRTAIEESDLADISKMQYLSRLRNIIKMTGEADAWTAIIKHTKTIAALQAEYGDQPSSMHMFATSVLTSFKHMPELKDLAPVSFKAWVEVNDEALKPLEYHAKTALPTKRQEAGVIDFKVLVAKRDALPLGSDARLLISMYTMIPPRRNDFAQLAIYKENQPLNTPGNYLILPAKGAGVAELVMNAYKTSKKYGQIREDLPADLLKEIRASLNRSPREYLFVSTRTGLPYTNEGVFGAWVNGTLKRVLRKPTTITLLRHSFLTFMKMEDKPMLEREIIARRMQHSVLQQIQYRFIMPK